MNLTGERHICEKKAGRGSAGSVMLEFVLAFPVILTLILACMQFAHMWTARQVVRYAAFCAARAALVCERGEYQKAGQQAAEQVCAWIVLGKRAGEQDKRVPGWGVIPGSGAVRRKTKVKMEQIDRWNVKATVTHDFALVFPLVGPMIGWGMDPWARSHSQRYLEQHADATGNIGKSDMVKWPHVRFTETAVLAKPYVTLPRMGIPVSGW